MASVSLRQDARPAHRTSGPLGVVVLAVLLSFVMAAFAPTASAYPAEVETTCSTSVSEGDRVPRGSDVLLRVSSDAAEPQGTATFRLGQAVERTVPVADGEAAFTIPSNLKPGRYRLTADYNPPADSGFKSCSTQVSRVVVTAGPGGTPGDGGGQNGGGGQGGSGPDDSGSGVGAPEASDGAAAGPDADQAGVGGILPNTGGVAFWLLLAGLALVLCGALLLVRRRVTA